MKIRVWAPAENDEYVLRDHVTKRTFSNYRSNTFIVEVVGDFPWIVKCAELEELYRKTADSGRGFFSVSPWNPDAKELRKQIKARFAAVFESDIDIYGYFESSGEVAQLMELRDAAGGINSGEWRIGSCFRNFENFNAIDIRKDLSFFLDNVANVGFLLDLSEMQQSLLLVKSYDGARADIDRLLISEKGTE